MTSKEKSPTRGNNGIEPRVYTRKEHTVSRNDIDYDALKIMYRLIRHGFRAYLVGGGVRDLLLDKKPKDFDIATDATPRKIKNLFRNCRIIGRRFKLAHIFFKDNKIIEVSTFRDASDPVDIEDDSEKTSPPRDNNYGTEQTDACRRDLTINGLFYDLSTFSIIDYVGGMDDLKNKLIRIIGDPRERFIEDPVRMIRAVRHAARSGFTLEDTCESAIKTHHKLILEASQVRVYEEIKKDLCSGSSLKILRLLSSTSILQHLLPELEVNNGELLQEGSFFSRVFENIDVTSAEEEVPITAILASISLFMTAYPDSTVPLHEQYEDKEDIIDHLTSCFVKLAVPRKEKERIEELLSLWHRVLTTPVDKLKKSNLERRRRVDELAYLLRWFNLDNIYDEQLEIALAATEKRKNQARRKGSKSNSGGNASGNKGRNRRGRKRPGQNSGNS